MTRMKSKDKFSSNSNVHLCWDCINARIPNSCDIYESITGIIENNFDEIKIIFNIPECNYFEEDKQIKDN